MDSEVRAERAHEGFDASGWEQLLVAARARARALCRNSPVDPDDLAQEALVRLLLEFDRVRNREAWLARVLANLFVSELRRHRLHSKWQEEHGGLARTAAGESARLHLRFDLLRHARALSAKDRLCLGLYTTGHSHREIALRLGEPVHRIGPRIARAQARLRRSLDVPT